MNRILVDLGRLLLHGNYCAAFRVPYLVIKTRESGSESEVSEPETDNS